MRLSTEHSQQQSRCSQCKCDIRRHVRPSLSCEGCYFIDILCSGLTDYRRNWKRRIVCPRCEEPLSRPINSQLVCSKARTGSPEHRNCSFCRSTLGRSRVECACCGPLHVKFSEGLNKAKDWRRGYVCGCCKRGKRVQELDENNHSSGMSQLINQMSLKDRDTEKFPPEPPDSVLDNAKTGLGQHMTKLHLNDVNTETLADETHTPEPMSTRSRSTLT